MFVLNLLDKEGMAVTEHYIQCNTPVETKAVVTHSAKAREEKEAELDKIAENEREQQLKLHHLPPTTQLKT